MKKVINVLVVFMLMATALLTSRCKTANKMIGVSGGHEYVDLGLPSGTLWATCNIGANTPEDCGYYYAWGETESKDNYAWATYKYCEGTNKSITKYCNEADFGNNSFVDELAVLQGGDDAATSNWGFGWCMPTNEQWEELVQNTTVSWTTQNGVNGRLFVASNGNAIFLPAFGSVVGSKQCDVSNYGHYWATSLYTNSPDYAWSFYFYSEQFGLTHYGNRYMGFNIRPVRTAK